MLPPTPAIAKDVETDVYTPCHLHEDRIRELETGQASHAGQLKVGEEIHKSVQNTLMIFSETMDRMGRSMERFEAKLDRLDAKVSDVQVEQASQKSKLDNMSKKLEVEEKTVEERRKTYKDIAFRYVFPPLLIIAAGIAGSHGRSWLAAIFKAMSGG